MSQPQSSSVHRYFSLADSFVEVRQFGVHATALEAPRGLDQAGYKRHVIAACMPQFAVELVDQLATLFPDEPQVAEDLLYGLCIEVNPGLDIHKVNLRPASAKRKLAPRKRRALGDDADGKRAHMARVSRDLKRRLNKKVHGQADAIDRLCRVVSRAAAGLSSPERPLGSFMLVGRTGTGKTELARCLARELLPDPQGAARNLIRIDCSEYALSHEYSKLLGSPPGYIGHEEQGLFGRQLAESPGALILFDEVEKAHPRLHNLLLQVLEEGCLTDGRGQRLDLSQNFVAMTSNAGAEDIRGLSRSLGFQAPAELSHATLTDISQQALEQRFSPEFLGRLDEIVVFADLDQHSANKIAQDQLTQLAIRVRRRGVRVAFTSAVARWIVERGFSKRFGARELRAVIQREVEPLLAELLLEGSVGADDLIRARIQHGELHFVVEA